MSVDEWDARADDYYDQLLQEFYRDHGPEIAGDAIDGFQAERLQSYFTDNPTLVELASSQLKQARRLCAAGFHDAGIVFAASAIEVAVKQAILRPVVYGLVHSAPAALIIAELSLGHTALDRFKSLLFDVLGDLLGMPLRDYVHQGSKKPLWDEIKATQEARNAVVHRAEPRSTEDAIESLRVASAVVDTLFPAVVSAVGLHMHGTVVCAKKGCE